MKDKIITLGQKIQIQREKHGLSQDELAEKLDVSRQTISNWENDKVKLDITKAEQICRLFEVSMDYLRSEEYAPHANDTKNSSNRVFIISIATFTVSVIALVISVIFLLKSPSPDAVSSTITFTNSFAGAAVAIVCVVACALSIYFIAKNKK